MYKKENVCQMTFSDQFFYSDEDPVSDEHPYMKMANLFKWKELLDKLVNFYSKRGRSSIPIKNMVLLLMVKHKHNFSDEELIERVATDMALQKALNITFRNAQLKISYIQKGNKRIKKIKGYIDPSSLTKFRKRIGLEGTQWIDDAVTKFLLEHKLIRSKRVLVDTTVSPSNIAYPTDMHLMNEAREYLIKVIKQFSSKKVRTRCREGKKFFLRFIKFGKKDRSKYKQYHDQMLGYVQRNLTQAKKVLQHHGHELKESIHKKLTAQVSTIEIFLAQQREVSAQIGDNGSKKGIKIKDRIVSLWKPYVRAIPRGKVGKPVEFGAKILYECRDSFIKVLGVTFDNLADCKMLEEHFSRWKGLILGGDRGFHSAENTALAQEHKLKHYHVEKKGKNKDPVSWSQKQTRRKRAGIEAKFSLLKRKYGLNKNRYSRGEDGEKQWIFLSALSHNLDRAFSLI